MPEATPASSPADKSPADKSPADKGAPSASPDHHPGGGSQHAMPVPEPSTLFLVGTGLVGLALTARRRKRPR